MSEEGEPVTLFVYDLTKGLANQISSFILGKYPTDSVTSMKIQCGNCILLYYNIVH